MKIFVSVTESSADEHAANFLRVFLNQLKSQGVTPEVIGIGGPLLRKIPDFRSIFDAESLRVMGIVEVLARIWELKKKIKTARQVLTRFAPDLVITFDGPDFHFRLLRNLDLPSHCFKLCAIPPKVWVWRSHRIEEIRKVYSAVWVIFPFEKEMYQSAGIPTLYAGNPMFNGLKLSGSSYSKVSNDPDPSLKVVVMPGSRPSEIRRHFPLVIEVMDLLQKKVHQKLEVHIPVPQGENPETWEKIVPSSDRIRYLFRQDPISDVFDGAAVGLIKSGTSTLQSTLLGCPTVIFYKTHPVTEFFLRAFVPYLGPVGLPNILLGIEGSSESIFPEYLGYQANPKDISDALFQLIQDQPLSAGVNRRSQLEAIERLREILFLKENVNEKVTTSILEMLRDRPRKQSFRRYRVFTGLVSFLWGCLNFALRRFRGLHLKKLPCEAVLIGNLQVGGAGKTPLIRELILQALQTKKYRKVWVVSRGYGGTAERSGTVLYSGSRGVYSDELGDEVSELAREITDANFIVGANRWSVVEEFIQSQKITENDLVCMDDGFQSCPYRVTETWLCVTRHAPQQMIFRDFIGEVRFADRVFVTKGWPIWASRFKYAPSNRFHEVQWVPRALPHGPILLFTALGDGSEVKDYYERFGVTILSHEKRRDHSELSLGEWERLLSQAKALNACLAMTPKDYEKVRHFPVDTHDPEIFILNRQIANPSLLRLKSWV